MKPSTVSAISDSATSPSAHDDVGVTATAEQRPARPPADLPRTAPAAVARFFRHASPVVLLTLTAAALAGRLALGGWRWSDLWVALGVLAWWPFNEWLIHVFVLHRRPRAGGGLAADYAVARKHREHHRDPWHLPLVFIPLHVYPPAVLALPLLGWVLLRDLHLASTFVAVYLLLSLHYEWSHYLAHIAWQPPLRYYHRRVHEHRLHHFRNDGYWWGVSMGLGDRVLGTAPDSQQVPRRAVMLDGAAD
jgi:hypothetical protein